MQYRVYNRRTLKYVDGGYCREFNIDDDYIVNNNSTVSVVKKSAPIVKQKTETVTVTGTYDIGVGNKITSITVNSGNATIDSYLGSKYTVNVTNAAVITIFYEIKDTLSNVVVGDIIGLIDNSGAYHKGVITAVDDTALTISYKSDKELFNDNMPNPYINKFADNSDVEIVGKFGVDLAISILTTLFKAPANMAEIDDEEIDKLKKLPLTFVADGDVLDDEGNPKMLWTWSNDSIGIVDWLTELFEKYNLSLSWDIDFDISNNNLANRNPQYIVTLSAITKSGGIVKDNVDMQTITYTVKEFPDATVCYVIDSTTKELLYISSGVNLINPATVQQNHIIVRNGTNWNEGSNNETNLTSYISVNLKNKYTFSENITDGKERLIIAYDKSKNKIGYWAYNSNLFTFTLNGMQYVPRKQDENLTAEELEKEIKYIRINYFNGATEVQLERGEEKTAFDEFNKPAIFYLYEKDGEYSISTNKAQRLEDGRGRVLPVKTVIATYNESNDGTDDTTPEDVAKDKLIPSQFNQAIEIRISSDSKMFDFQNAKFGDQYEIINEQGSVNSVYTGRKFTNANKWVTLYFGLGRQNYTDLMQMRLRKSRYTEVYNQR